MFTDAPSASLPQRDRQPLAIEHRVDTELGIGDPWVITHETQAHSVDHAQCVGRTDDEEQGFDRKRVGSSELKENRRTQQQCADDDADRDQREQPRTKVHVSRSAC